MSDYKSEPKFKVGDRIYPKYHKPSNDLEIIEVIRGDGHYGYRIKNHQTNGTYFLWEYEMCDYKLAEEETSIDLTVKGEEVKERIEIMIPEGYEYVIESGKIIFHKKKPTYPQTYEECLSVLGIYNGLPDVEIYNAKPSECKLFESLIRLKRCRDAYWKIAGEEMGLGKPWEPDWNDGTWKWCMSYSGNYIEFDQYKSKHHTLAFPTEEMRDAFYENFKEEIEICKEFL